MATTRLMRLQERKSRRAAVIYLILSILFIFLMIRWGLPGFIQLLSWWTGADKPSTVSTNLKVPPQTPVLAPLPEATFSAKIKITGVAQPQVTVRLIANGVTRDEQESGDDGRFEFGEVSLLPGRNVIGVQAVNANNLESDITQAEIILDQEPPVLDILEPADETDYYGASQRNVQIRGTMGERGEVEINGNFVLVSSSGEFSYRLSLSPGMNEITITAADTAGNQVSRLLRLRYTD